MQGFAAEPVMLFVIESQANQANSRGSGVI
jgi:hypothetical protein